MNTPKHPIAKKYRSI